MSTDDPSVVKRYYLIHRILKRWQGAGPEPDQVKLKKKALALAKGYYQSQPPMALLDPAKEIVDPTSESEMEKRAYEKAQSIIQSEILSNIRPPESKPYKSILKLKRKEEENPLPKQVAPIIEDSSNE